jgi:hypothetical protein
MSLVSFDEASLALMGLTLVLGVALGFKNTSPDTPYSRLMNQADVSKTRNKVPGRTIKVQSSMKSQQPFHLE